MTFSYLFFLIVSLSLLLNAKGEIYNVGDTDGWSLFYNYTKWAKGKHFHVGDTLVFNYKENTHNVIQVNKTAYKQCIKEPNLGVLESGKDSLNLAEVGQFWYICGVGDHCDNGQKLSIKVVP